MVIAPPEAKIAMIKPETMLLVSFMLIAECTIKLSEKCKSIHNKPVLSPNIISDRPILITSTMAIVSLNLYFVKTLALPWI